MGAKIEKRLKREEKTQKGYLKIIELQNVYD